MSLFVVEHRHPPERCPAANPQMAPFLLHLLSEPEARKNGVRIHGEAVATGRHQLYLILDAADEGAVRSYLAPFSQVGTLDVVGASHCEQVVARGHC